MQHLKCFIFVLHKLVHHGMYSIKSCNMDCSMQSLSDHGEEKVDEVSFSISISIMIIFIGFLIGYLCMIMNLEY